MRKLYALSRGRSRATIRGIFRKLRPVELADSDALAALRNDGVVTVPGYLRSSATIRDYLETQPTYRVSAVRENYMSCVLLECPEIAALLTDPFILGTASAYLGCEPILAGINAWRSFASDAANQGDLDAAAQLYHYDCDWPAFVKFFFYLTDVGPDNGPFCFVAGTHETKRSYRDGRQSDEYILTTYPGQERIITGRAGDLIIADTIGFHKGQRVKEGSRLILQLEFAVSRFGASCQYELFPKSKRPSPNRTFDIFSG